MATQDINKIKIECAPLSNRIYIGRVNKSETEWLDKRDATDEVIEAVRDHLAEEARREKRDSFGWEWTRKDGKIVKLVVSIEEDDDRNS